MDDHCNPQCVASFQPGLGPFYWHYVGPMVYHTHQRCIGLVLLEAQQGFDTSGAGCKGHGHYIEARRSMVARSDIDGSA
jgi:hypothetical protein